MSTASPPGILADGAVFGGILRQLLLGLALLALACAGLLALANPGSAQDAGGEADLEIYKGVNQSQYAVVGEPFTYEISVYNNGPDAATNVVVEDTLPEGLDFAGFPPDDQCSYDGGTRKVSCNFGDLELYDSDFVNFEVTPTAEGTVENTATAGSDAPDPDDSNNQSSATTTVGTAPPLPGSLVDDPGCQTSTLPRNDDRSTGNVALPFDLNFFGNSYGSA